MSYPRRAYPGGRRNGPWKGRTTSIAVGDAEIWNVPRGFGKTYLRVIGSWAKDPAEGVRVLPDVLSLVGYEVTSEVVASWPLRKRVDAEVWAICVHARASDNPSPVPPRPEWMPEPWKGPEQGEGVFASNPTVLT